MTLLYTAVVNKVPSRFPCKAVTHLHSIKYFWPPCEEKYCVIITMKVRSSDSVAHHCVFSPTIEQGRCFLKL